MNTPYNTEANAIAFTIRCMYDDFVKGKDAVNRDLFADNFVWNTAESSFVNDEAEIGGVEAFLDKAFWNQPEWEQVGFRVDELLASERITVQGYYSAVYKPTGKVLLAQMLHVWTVEDGKITRLQELHDTQNFYEVMAK